MKLRPDIPEPYVKALKQFIDYPSLETVRAFISSVDPLISDKRYGKSHGCESWDCRACVMKEGRENELFCPFMLFESNMFAPSGTTVGWEEGRPLAELHEQALSIYSLLGY